MLTIPVLVNINKNNVKHHGRGTTSFKTNTKARPKNISRHSRHKRNKFPVSASVHGFTTAGEMRSPSTTLST